MSNLYPFGISAAFAGDAALDTETVNVCLVMTGAAGYTYNSAHNGLDHVSAFARASNGIGTLATKAISASGSALVFDAADTTLSSVTGAASGSVFHAYVTLVSAAGGDAASVLLSYNDLTAPVTANGGNITIQHNAAGIFRIWTDS